MFFSDTVDPQAQATGSSAARETSHAATMNPDIDMHVPTDSGNFVNSACAGGGYRVVIGGSPYSSASGTGLIPGFPSSPPPMLAASTASTATTSASPAHSGTALLMMAAQLEEEAQRLQSSAPLDSPSSHKSSGDAPLPPKKRARPSSTRSGSGGATKKRKPSANKKNFQSKSTTTATSASKKKAHKPDYGDDLRGITMRASGKWQAQLYYAGQSRYIGVFETRAKAAIAYEVVRDKLKTNAVRNEPQTTEKWEQAVKEARKAAGLDEEKDEKKAESAAGRKTKQTTAARVEIASDPSDHEM